MTDIWELIETTKSFYSSHSSFSFTEFEDVFGSFLNDETENCFALLENANNLDGSVDLYETLSCFVVFSNEEFPTKLNFMF